MLHRPKPTGMDQHILNQYHCALDIATQFTSLAVQPICNFIGKPGHHRQAAVALYDVVREFGKLMFVNHMFRRLVAGRLQKPTNETCSEALSHVANPFVCCEVCLPMGGISCCTCMCADLWIEAYVFPIEHLVRIQSH